MFFIRFFFIQNAILFLKCSSINSPHEMVNKSFFSRVSNMIYRTSIEKYYYILRILVKIWKQNFYFVISVVHLGINNALI